MAWEWELSPTAERTVASWDPELKGAFNRRMGELMRDPTPGNEEVTPLPRPPYPPGTFGYSAYPFWVTFRVAGSVVQVGGVVDDPQGF